MIATDGISSMLLGSIKNESRNSALILVFLHYCIKGLINADLVLNVLSGSEQSRTAVQIGY